MPRASNSYSPNGRNGGPRPGGSTLRPRAKNTDTMTTTTSMASSNPTEVTVSTAHVGIYGWRKYCLYVTLLLVLVLSIVNIGMITFVYRVMNVKPESAGPLHFYDERLLVKGRAEFQEGLSVSNISGFDNSTLLVESNERILLRSYESPQSSERSQVTMDGLDVSVDTDNLAFSYEGETYFRASPEETVIASNDIVVQSDTGLRVDGGILTPVINNDYQSGNGLLIDSVGQDLTMQGAQSATLQSDFGDVNINGGQRVVVSSNQGDISLNAANLLLPDLPGSGNGNRQLCVCRTNRRVFSHPTCQSNQLFPNPCV